MAAYGALVSVMQIIEQLRQHPQPPITLDKQQVESLTENISFLQEFLEVYNSHYSKPEMEHLRSRIADAAYAAEDIIESHIVDQIHARSASTHDDRGNISSVDFYQVLQKVIENIDIIKKEVIEIKEKLGTQNQQQTITTSPVVSSKSPSTEQSYMVGFGDVLIEMLDKITSRSNSQRQIIPIYGMGGIGKTTLAKSVYTNPLIVHHFDVRTWITISQEYNMHRIFIEVLLCLEGGSREGFNQMSETELGGKIYKYLYGRRYLIIMDDMWSNDVWDKVKNYFPNNNNGSRIIITTRLSNVASDLTSGFSLQMSFLDQDKGWSLFCKTVFGEEDCPHELEEIGKKIAENLKGLPLSIVVLGGVLAKSKQTREYWEYVLQNLISIVNLEDNERCLKILQASYDQLPVHLKVCFLYMGAFPEDSKIRVSELIKLWVAEGFLKPISGESLEESGKKYLMDLVARNLILVSGLGDCGNIKLCGIHDLLRDLCLRESRKEKFLYVSNQHSLNTPYESVSTQRHIAIYENSLDKECLDSLKSESMVRSLLCYVRKDRVPLFEPRLLRVLKDGNVRYTAEIFQLVNLRYLTYDASCPIFSYVSLLWNLQTLVVYGSNNAPLEILKMPFLRHVKSYNLTFRDPPSNHVDSVDDFALRNLQSLSRILNLKFSEEILSRIRNVRRLKLLYKGESVVISNYCLNNLGCLDKLESFSLDTRTLKINRSDMQNVTFPHSLKKLSLYRTGFSWEDINTKIGSLPLLQVLKLYDGSFTIREESTWETVDGQFRSLKYLEIRGNRDPKYWIMENNHFPCLEHLVLVRFHGLKEIPADIGEIPTLKSIELINCGDSLVISAKRIVDEQEELGNEGLQVSVHLGYRNDDIEGLMRLASHNFHIRAPLSMGTTKQIN